MELQIFDMNRLIERNKMAKYVIEGAEISCQYGSKSCEIMDFENHHITTGDNSRQMGNELDYLSGKSGCFGGCRSPYLKDSSSIFMRSCVAGNLHELAAEGKETSTCVYQAVFPWQNTNQHVFISGQKALMEDGWTICLNGLGIVSIISSGQEGCDPVKKMQEKLKELQQIVTQYMRDNGIEDKYKNSLMESILLWNGYEEIPWEYESNEMNRFFCTYLEKENPILFNYFERGLYLGEGDSRIDLTYMLGIYKAAGNKVFIEDCITTEMIDDIGMFNGFLEASRIEKGKGLDEILLDYLYDYNSLDYNSRQCYEDFIARTSEETRVYFRKDHFSQTDGKSDQEVDLMILEQSLRYDYRLDKIADAFMDRLKKQLK